MLESPAWRVLSNAARLVVARIEIEHMSHGGRENGNLTVTYDNFTSYGIRRSSIADAIREAEAVGFIRVIQRGRGGNADFRRASKYALSWLPMADGTLTDHPWRRIQTMGEANALVRRMRSDSKKR